MAQRSLHAVIKVYYWSMSCFATVPRQTVPACSAKVSNTKWPLLHHVVWGFHKDYHKDRSRPHSTKHDTQPITYLISKQAIPYWTCGGTCYPGVSTPKIRSIADSSMTIHITWRNPTVYTSPTMLKSQHRSSPWSIHILTDGRPLITKSKAKLNITKDRKTCMTLMTAWLSITNEVWTQILKYEA
jgi:hypothetical protein